MKDARIVYNNICVECNDVEEEMIALGANIIICRKCFKKMFPRGQYDKTSDAYKALIAKRKSKVISGKI